MHVWYKSSLSEFIVCWKRMSNKSFDIIKLCYCTWWIFHILDINSLIYPYFILKNVFCFGKYPVAFAHHFLSMMLITVSILDINEVYIILMPLWTPLLPLWNFNYLCKMYHGGFPPETVTVSFICVYINWMCVFIISSGETAVLWIL